MAEHILNREFGRIKCFMGFLFVYNGCGWTLKCLLIDSWLLRFPTSSLKEQKMESFVYLCIGIFQELLTIIMKGFINLLEFLATRTSLVLKENWK